MKTTIDIANSILIRAKARAREDGVTLRSLIEQSLAATLDQESPSTVIRPVTFKGKGMSQDFVGASWEKIREAIY